MIGPVESYDEKSIRNTQGYVLQALFFTLISVVTKVYGHPCTYRFANLVAIFPRFVTNKRKSQCYSAFPTLWQQFKGGSFLKEKTHWVGG